MNIYKFRCTHKKHPVNIGTIQLKTLPEISIIYSWFTLTFSFTYMNMRQIQDTQISVQSLINKNRWLQIPHSFSFVQKQSAYATPSTHSAAEFVSISPRKEKKCVTYPLFPPVSVSNLSLLLIKSTILKCCLG